MLPEKWIVHNLFIHVFVVIPTRVGYTLATTILSACKDGSSPLAWGIRTGSGVARSQ